MTPLPDDPYSAEIDAAIEPLKRGAGIAQRNEAKAAINQIVRKARLDELHNYAQRKADSESDYFNRRLGQLEALQQPDETIKEKI